MGMAPILFDNTPSTEGPLSYLVKIGQAVLEKTRYFSCFKICESVFIALKGHSF